MTKQLGSDCNLGLGIPVLHLDLQWGETPGHYPLPSPLGDLNGTHCQGKVGTCCSEPLLAPGGSSSLQCDILFSPSLAAW